MPLSLLATFGNETATSQDVNNATTQNPQQQVSIHFKIISLDNYTHVQSDFYSIRITNEDKNQTVFNDFVQFYKDTFVLRIEQSDPNAKERTVIPGEREPLLNGYRSNRTDNSFTIRDSSLLTKNTTYVVDVTLISVYLDGHLYCPESADVPRVEKSWSIGEQGELQVVPEFSNSASSALLAGLALSALLGLVMISKLWRKRENPN